MCRVRNTHTGAPWTTAYICLTLDESCTDENNNYVDKPLTVRMVQWQPFCVTQPFDPKTPVCAACKKTNRTRSFCRERHKHRQLPWCTVYVLLSALDAADPTTVVAGASKPLHNDEKEVGKDGETGDDAKEYFGDVKKEGTSPTNAGGQDETTSKASDSVEGGANIKHGQKEKSSSGGNEDGDDIHDIAESRTFLAKVNCKSTSIHWLELTEYETNDSSGVRGMISVEGTGSYTPPHGAAKGGDPNQPNYYSHAHAIGYQQHQNALQNHQQYFYQMQQRHQQHYAAQQAAWQAQYNQQGAMPGGQPPHHGQPPPHHGQMPPASPQEGAPVLAPVTAGEAAAQQQRRNREMAEPAGGQLLQQQPPPPQLGQQPQQGGQQGQGQQQQWMMYQQMYQAQMPPMNSQSPPYQPQQPGRPPQGQPQDDQHSQGAIMPMPNNDQQQQQHFEQPMTPENGKENHDESAKRQRLL